MVKQWKCDRCAKVYEHELLTFRWDLGEHGGFEDVCKSCSEKLNTEIDIFFKRKVKDDSKPRHIFGRKK